MSHGRNSPLSEAEIQARVMLAVGARPGVRLWRNNTGKAWQGEVLSHTSDLILLRRPRLIEFGLCVGSSDLIGHIRGQFLAMEVKTATGEATEDQSRFLEHIRSAGGVAGVVRSPQDAEMLLGIADSS